MLPFNDTYITDDMKERACNKYQVYAQLQLISNGTVVSTSGSYKLGNPDECLRIKKFGSDSSEYRNSNFCDSVHAEVTCLTNFDSGIKSIKDIFLLDEEKLRLLVTAHPCYQCAKYICYWNSVNRNLIKEVHYAGPRADIEVQKLFSSNNIKLLWHGEDGRVDY